MAKNILIFSDGTGQAGGLIPDERRSNVYKLFRATRCGPDSKINPDEQFAFYDAGLGSTSDASHIKFKWWRKIYNLLSQATGLGVTQNIIDCYTAILQVWEPGDKIFLFGFSRGAYTARCVGGVIAYCGVPTELDGAPIKRDLASCRATANEAVQRVYQHGSGKSAPRFAEQRKKLAANFREKYSSGQAIGSDKNAMSNTVPYFIGVWDTVAALGASWVRLFAIGAILFGLLWCALGVFWWRGWVPSAFTDYWTWILTSGATVLGLAAVSYLFSHVRIARGIDVPWWETLHIRAWKVKFYDTYLNPRVSYAKHALSIDENRADFERVSWTDKRKNNKGKAKDWFEQVWFAGVHSDIGGSYPETEARLSDQALKWMVDKATSANHPMKVDSRFLNMFPTVDGMQHDERKSSKISWKKGIRKIPKDAPLHDSVKERFELPAVLQFDEIKSYRPESLRNHDTVKHLYN